MIELRIIEGEGERTLRIARDEIVVGRSNECDVVIDGRYVSSRHAKILFGLVVADLDSLNGTFLDGERVREATPILGRTLQLGGDEGDVRIEVRRVADAAWVEAGPATTPDLRAATTVARSLFDTDIFPLLSRLRRERERLASEDEDETIQAPSGEEDPSQPAGIDRPETPRSEGELLHGAATSFLLTEMLAFLRQAERAMQGVAASFTDTPAPEAVFAGDHPPLRELFHGVLKDPMNDEARERFRSYVRGLRRWLSIWVQAYPAAAGRFADQLPPNSAIAEPDVRERLRRLARDCADEILRAGYRHGA